MQMLKTVGGLLLLLALGAQAQMYKWVDAQGVTHYSQTPPPAGTQTQTVAPKSASGGGKASGSGDWQSQQTDFNKRQMDKKDQQSKADAQAAKDATQRQRCAEARDHLSRMKSASGIYQVNENGERVFMDPKASEQAIRSLEADIAKYCS